MGCGGPSGGVTRPVNPRAINTAIFLESGALQW
jgi:hypothetical protein